MSNSVPKTLSEGLAAAGQEHLLAHAATLSSASAANFTAQLASVDWILVARLARRALEGGKDQEDPRSLAPRAVPPRSVVRLPATPGDRERWQHAREHGEAWLRAGKLGVIVVAGGQGTRLGSSQPKGIYPIGPLSGKSLFQWFCEQLRARRERSGQPIPYAVMTSDATHQETAAYLASHDCFGLPADEVRLFRQGHLPAIDAETGRALLTAPGELALSPDGHGGMLAALANANILQDWAAQGIETLFYHQVDNPSTPLCDPAFIGLHLDAAADVSTKVVAKRSATEKMGVAVDVDGVTRIIEYSDLPADIAARTDSDGRLTIWAGNTAMHVLQREFLERALVDDRALPFHIARKVVPYVNDDGESVTPSEPNAFKFERFIFDVLPWAKTALIVEGDRAEEFNPVKNRDGDDSPETSRRALMAQHRRWLRRAGVLVDEAIPVEISPLVALGPDDLIGRIPPGAVISKPLYLTESRMQEFHHHAG